MKRRMISSVRLVILASCLFLFVAPAAAQGKASPTALVEKTTFDFGEVVQGEKVEHKFVVKNTGKGPLELQRVEPACGCTAAVPEDRVVKPGASSSVSTVFDTAGFSGDKVKTVRLYTNDPKSPSIVLTLKGTVNPEVIVNPPRLYFGKVRKGEAIERQVKVNVLGNSKIRITSVHSRHEGIELEVSGDEKSRSIVATLSDTLPVGLFRSSVVVKTSSIRTPVVNVPVFAKVQGDLRLVPSDVSFGLLEGPLKEKVSRLATLHNDGQNEVKIVSISSNNPGIKAVAKKGTTAGSYQVSVAVSEEIQGPFRAVVKIKTDHPEKDQRELLLPVFGIVSKKGA